MRTKRTIINHLFLLATRFRDDEFSGWIMINTRTESHILLSLIKKTCPKLYVSLSISPESERRAHRNFIKRHKTLERHKRIKKTYPWLSHFCSGSGKFWGQLTKISRNIWGAKFGFFLLFDLFFVNFFKTFTYWIFFLFSTILLRQ